MHGHGNVKVTASEQDSSLAFIQGGVFATVTRNMFGLVLTKREPKFVIGYAWFQYGGL